MKMLKQFIAVMFIASVGIVSADGSNALLHLGKTIRDQEIASHVLTHARQFVEKAQDDGWTAAEIDQAVQLSIDIMNRNHQGNAQLDLRADLLKTETATLKVIKYFNVLATLTNVVAAAALLLMILR